MYKHLLSSALVATVFATAGCGNNPEPATPAGEHPGHGNGEHGQHGEHGEQHHPDLTPQLHAFHEVMGPLWHLEKGPDRAAKTCAQGAALRDKATATGDKDLLAATTSLVAECEKEGKPEFDARFVAVHDRFHALAEKK